MLWSAFTHGGVTYDLTHLHPCTMFFERKATEEKPVVRFTVDVTFSLHCFSRAIPMTPPYDRSLEYSDARETRLFDVERYELTKRLPELIRGLATRRCHQTGKGNFVTFELIREGGLVDRYDVFFRVSKSSNKGRINLYVESAYLRQRGGNPAGKPIRLEVILHNTLNKILIRP